MSDQTDTSTVSNGAAANAFASTASAKGSDDLDSILKQFEAGDSKATATPNAVPIVKAFSALRDEFRPVIEHVNAERESKLQQRVEADIKSSVDKFNEGLQVKAPSEIVEGLLEREVGRSQETRNRWEKRYENPSAWDAAVAETREKYKPTLASYANPAATQTNDARNDLDAAAASVRNVSTEPPKLEPLDTHAAVHNWTDRQWDDYKRKYYAQQQAAQK